MSPYVAEKPVKIKHLIRHPKSPEGGIEDNFQK